MPMGIADLHHGFPDSLSHFSELPGGKLELGGIKDGTMLGPLSTERFSEADSPPEAPADLSFRFEPTTLYGPVESGAAPCDLANRLLDFLDTQVVSSVTKVRRKKFTIKA